jgi:hypothetical protein
MNRLRKIIPSIYSTIGTMYQELMTIGYSPVAYGAPPLLVVHPL